MKVLFVDIETTGLDISTSSIIEIGAVAWDMLQKRPLAFYSDLVHNPSVVINSMAEQITGIKMVDTQQFGVTEEVAVSRVAELFDKVDAVAGHNFINFDFKFIQKACVNAKVKLPEKLVIDTIFDLPIEAPRSKRLEYLAADHGFLNPFPHRALVDALTTAKLCSMYDADRVIKSAQSPLVSVTAKVDYDTRQLAQKLGFNWIPDLKVWKRTMRRFAVENTKYPFEITVEE